MFFGSERGSLRFGSNPFSGPLSLFSNTVFISGTRKSLFSGLEHIFGTSYGLLSDYTNPLWNMKRAFCETKAELKT
jgi:hypothetical protein